MSVSSVGNHPFAGTIMELPGAKTHRGHQCSCIGTADVSPGTDDAGNGSIIRSEGRDDHLEQAEYHDRHGGGFGYGHFAMGMGHIIHGQMRAARRAVASEQIGAAAADLTVKMAEVIGAAGQPAGLDAAQKDFTAAVQDVVERFDSGEIGRRRALAGFRAAFEDLVGAVRSGSNGDKSAVDEAVAVEADAEGVNATADGAAETDAKDVADAGGSLVENIGQVFNSFMQGLRSDLAALTGMRTFMSPENRDRVFGAFAGLYRELAGLDGREAEVRAATPGVDQLA